MNKIEQAIGHLGAALVQASPKDDEIIIAHIRDAHAALTAALAWAEDEQRGRHKAEEDRLNARSRIESLEESLRFAKVELQCLCRWLDRAVDSDYRYRDDPALPGHRKSAEMAAKAIDRDLNERLTAALARPAEGRPDGAKIVREFEGMFGNLTATERDWLTRQIVARPAEGGEALRKQLLEFEDFLNEPPQYEDRRMVREYRHEAYRKWAPLLQTILSTSRPAQAEDGWKPIDNDTPHDEMLWTLWDGINNKTNKPARYYHAACLDGDSGDWVDQDGDVIDTPTHYRPLPEPPRDEKMNVIK